VGTVDWIYLAQDSYKCPAVVKNGNEPSGSIKCGEYLDWLRNYQLPKKVSASYS
jgi:hypothetical protein